MSAPFEEEENKLVRDPKNKYGKNKCIKKTKMVGDPSGLRRIMKHAAFLKCRIKESQAVFAAP